jgi:hypothetical protein
LVGNALVLNESVFRGRSLKVCKGLLQQHRKTDATRRLCPSGRICLAWQEQVAEDLVAVVSEEVVVVDLCPVVEECHTHHEEGSMELLLQCRTVVAAVMVHHHRELGMLIADPYPTRC